MRVCAFSFHSARTSSVPTPPSRITHYRPSLSNEQDTLLDGPGCDTVAKGLLGCTIDSLQETRLCRQGTSPFQRWMYTHREIERDKQTTVLVSSDKLRCSRTSVWLYRSSNTSTAGQKELPQVCCRTHRGLLTLYSISLLSPTTLRT